MKLAIRWVRDEITTREVGAKLGIKTISQVIYTMGSALRAAHREGLIK